LDFVEAS
jgi:hypothetical protein